jgi:hypothetical protein
VKIAGQEEKDMFDKGPGTAWKLARKIRAL